MKSLDEAPPAAPAAPAAPRVVREVPLAALGASASPGAGGVRDAESPAPRSGMPETALVFLDDPVARRLAVAWTACGGDESVWFAAAGIPASQMADASRAASALRFNGICRDGGVTDPLALRYIAAIVAEPLYRAASKASSKSKRRR
jgi:hypothetical protein